MKTLEELEDDDMNARLNKQATADGVVFPDDLRNRLLYHILVQLERIANSLFMQNKLEHEKQTENENRYLKCCHGDESYPASPEDIRIMRENPDPLDVAEDG